MENLFKIKENFLEEFFVKFIFLFLIILGFALTFLVFEKYYIFLDFFLLPFVLLLVGFAFLFIFWNRRKINLKKNRIDYLIIGFILLFCIFNAFYFYESKIEGGHDQGGYFETTLLLSKTGSYSENYLERPISLAIPGYSIYPNNITRWHFIPGGSTYFSIFHYIFDLTGFPIALAFSLFFAVSIIYFLCKRLRNWKTGVFFILFFLFYYYTIYFSRATWVENIQLLLVWFFVYLFIRGYQERNMSYLIYSFLPVSLLITIRLEALLYIFIYIILLFYFFLFRKKEFSFNRKLLPIFIFIFLFGILTIVNIFIFDSSAILFDQGSPIQTIIKTIESPKADIALGPREAVPYNQQLFIWLFLFFVFGPFFILIFLCSILNFLQEDKTTKKNILVLSVLVLPCFIFLIYPSVQLYIPWAVRRFWGVFIPYVFILFALFLSNPHNILRKSKRALVGFVSMMFLFTSLPTFSIFGLAEGRGILNYGKEVASHFDNKKDMVIFWNRYGYENWGPPLYFLYGTNVVFDRAPAFDKEIYALFMKDYENVYIATSFKPNERLYGYFEGNVTYIKTIQSKPLKMIESSACHLGRFVVYPETFESYYQIVDLCNKNNPPTKIVDYQINLNIYKINDTFKEQFVKEYYDPNYKITREAKHIWGD